MSEAALVERLVERLRAEGLDPSPWSNGPHDHYGAHEHGYDKVIAVESGSIRFDLPDSAASVDQLTNSTAPPPCSRSNSARSL